MCITSYLSVQNAICHFIHQLCSLLSLECLNLCLPPMQAYWPSVTPQFCYFFLKVKISIKLLHSSLQAPRKLLRGRLCSAICSRLRFPRGQDDCVCFIRTSAFITQDLQLKETRRLLFLTRIPVEGFLVNSQPSSSPYSLRLSARQSESGVAVSPVGLPRAHWVPPAAAEPWAPAGTFFPWGGPGSLVGRQGRASTQFIFVCKASV